MKGIYTHPKVWISFVGFSPIAVLNTIYLAAERDCFIPDTFIFFYTKKTESSLNFVIEGIHKIEPYLPSTVHTDLKRKIEKHKISELQSIKEYIQLLTKIVEQHQKNLARIAIDITTGLKIMTIAAISVAIKKKVDRIYYTLLLDRTFEDKFALEIPRQLSELYMVKGNGDIILLKGTCNNLFQV